MASKSKNKLKKVGITIISGSITGAIECCITYPLEYAKTVMQLYPHMSKKGLGHTFKDTIR
jgi:solute carrier family 25 citrate transporter 1